MTMDEDLKARIKAADEVVAKAQFALRTAEIARKALAWEAAGVKPGDVVMIEKGKHAGKFAVAVSLATYWGAERPWLDCRLQTKNGWHGTPTCQYDYYRPVTPEDNAPEGIIE